MDGFTFGTFANPRSENLTLLRDNRIPSLVRALPTMPERLAAVICAAQAAAGIAARLWRFLITTTA
jgi:hypothetical protein